MPIDREESRRRYRRRMERLAGTNRYPDLTLDDDEWHTITGGLAANEDQYGLLFIATHDTDDGHTSVGLERRQVEALRDYFDGYLKWLDAEPEL